MHKKTRWQFELMTLLGIPIITKLCSRQIYGHFPWKGIRRPHAKLWNETGKTSYYKTKWETTKYQFLNNPFCARFLHFYNRARHLMNGVIFRIHFITNNIGQRNPFLPSVDIFGIIHYYMQKDKACFLCHMNRLISNQLVFCGCINFPLTWNLKQFYFENFPYVICNIWFHTSFY